MKKQNIKLTYTHTKWCLSFSELIWIHHISIIYNSFGHFIHSFIHMASSCLSQLLNYIFIIFYHHPHPHHQQHFGSSEYIQEFIFNMSKLSFVVCFIRLNSLLLKFMNDNMNNFNVFLKVLTESLCVISFIFYFCLSEQKMNGQWSFYLNMN